MPKLTGAEKSARYRERHPDRAAGTRQQRRAWALKKRYGLTLTAFDALLAGQGGRCAICRTDEPGGLGVFHVDHDHTTGIIRGLLCDRCNRRLLPAGEDNPALLRAAANYLENTMNTEGTV